MVQRHMSYSDGVRQRDDKSPLDTVEGPTFPWEQHRVALGGEEERALLASGHVVKTVQSSRERRAEESKRKDRRRDRTVFRR